MSNINREYKDRLFKKVFEDKEDLLNLYNAINRTNYDNPNEIVVNTIEDYVYMSMKNDVSFLIYDVLNLYEHQSTSNPNMPLRGLFYLSDLYKGLFANHKDLYSTRLISLPTPQFIVFYNGNDGEPDERYLSLADAYIGNVAGETALDCKARLLNINYGHNKDLMERCHKLREYAIFVKRVKDNIKIGMINRDAVEEAIDWCIKENILKELLTKNRMEVTDMLLTEYDEKLHIENEKDISFEEGDSKRLIKQVKAKIGMGQELERIAEDLVEEMTVIEKIAEAIAHNAPDYNIDKIYKEYMNINN